MPSIAGHNVGKDNVRQSSPFESSSKSCGPFDQFRADDFHKEETFVEQGFDDGPCKSADRLFFEVPVVNDFGWKHTGLTKMTTGAEVLPEIGAIAESFDVPHLDRHGAAGTLKVLLLH